MNETSITRQPRLLFLQWHITERCNLRCSHCYQESYSSRELQFEDWLNIVEQFKELLRQRRKALNLPSGRGQITVTGGEPFIHKDFMGLLEVFAANRDDFNFAILTNGTLIDETTACKLKELSPSFVQVSIEGTRSTHEAIRGAGSYDLACSALRHLTKAGLRTMISFTAHRGNFREFPEVAQLGRKLKVSKVWSDRLIPCGSAREEMLSPEETQGFFQLMDRERRRWSWFSKTGVAMHRALQFLIAGGRPYRCTAGESLITIQPNGDLLPCRRMPIPVGNVMNIPLTELYSESELFQKLRNPETISEGCQGCFYSKLCRGGLKCLSYAVEGDPFKSDPGCWVRESSVNSQESGVGVKS